MTRWKIVFLAAAAAVFGAIFYSENFRGREYPVLLVYNPSEVKDYGHVLSAYEHVLQEMGVPFAKVKPSFLLSRDPHKLGRHGLTLIFPDGCAQSVPDGLRTWTEFFLNDGGSIAVVYDAGVKDPKGKFRKEGVFSEVMGVNNILYEENLENSYTYGHLKFRNPGALRTFPFPFGKTDKELFVTGYAYGRLSYPLARSKAMQDLSASEIYADMVAGDGKVYPGAVIRRYGKGKVMFANLPLGRLKSFSDDLPAKAFLQAFLYKVVRIPHLVNSPKAKGGIVFNWHIDSSVEWRTIPLAIQNRYLRPGIRYSIHVTAGEFRDKPGDGLGFDACGKGRPLLQELMKYGLIGSHGGWGHNWFAEKQATGEFKELQILAQVNRNSRCLSSVTGYPITEYSAPDGVHPQPDATRALEKAGISSYYYTGDTGSGPNRTFISGGLVSDTVFAFPVMPYGKSASLYEMKMEGRSEEDVFAWLKSIVEYARENRSVRLIYSHLYDTERYPAAMKRFIDLLEREQKAGLLAVEPMSYFTAFYARFLKTSYSFSFGSTRLSMEFSNPEGLTDIYVAVPSDRYQKPGNRESFDGGDGYVYIPLEKKNEDLIVLESD